MRRARGPLFSAAAQPDGRQDVVEVVRPCAAAHRLLQRFGQFLDRLVPEPGFVVDHRHPVRRAQGRVRLLPSFRFVGEHAGVKFLLLCKSRERGLQIDEPVADVEQEHAVRPQMPAIDGDRLAREKMQRDGVAGEGVDHEHAEGVRLLSFEHEARVAQRDGDVRAAVGEVGELRLREIDHLRIDLVEPECVAALSVRGQRARAQSHEAHGERLSLRKLALPPDRKGHAGCRTVIGERFAAAIEREILRSMLDAAVLHDAAQLGAFARVENAQRRIEIACENARARIFRRNLPRHDSGDDDGQRKRGIAQARGMRAHAPGDHHRYGCKRDRHFEGAVQNHRREHAAGQRAERAAQRDENVEFRQPGRVGFRRRELPVAEQANEEQPGHVERQREVEFRDEVDVLVRDDHRQAERQSDERDRRSPVVTAAERQDERDEIDRERGDPDQRHRRDVLRDEGCHRDQRERSERRENDPQSARARRGRGGFGVMNVAHQFAGAARCERAGHGDVGAGEREREKADRPEPRLLRGREGRLHEKGIHQQPAQGGGVVKAKGRAASMVSHLIRNLKAEICSMVCKCIQLPCN